MPPANKRRPRTDLRSINFKAPELYDIQAQPGGEGKSGNLYLQPTSEQAGGLGTDIGQVITPYQWVHPDEVRAPAAWVV
jgi:hypothetical protein